MTDAVELSGLPALVRRPAGAATTAAADVLTIGDACAFLSSPDGRRWDFVRVFALPPSSAPTRLGFLAQSPTGDGCAAAFSEILLERTTLADTRSGE